MCPVIHNIKIKVFCLNKMESSRKFTLTQAHRPTFSTPTNENPSLTSLSWLRILKCFLPSQLPLKHLQGKVRREIRFLPPWADKFIWWRYLTGSYWRISHTFRLLDYTSFSSLLRFWNFLVPVLGQDQGLPFFSKNSIFVYVFWL